TGGGCSDRPGEHGSDRVAHRGEMPGQPDHGVEGPRTARSQGSGGLLVRVLDDAEKQRVAGDVEAMARHHALLVFARARNSAGVRESSRRAPSIALVTVDDPWARTPRNVMQLCSA